MKQAEQIDIALPQSKKAKREGTFVDNMKLPIHRWFRYSAGFSASWVEEVLRSGGLKKKSCILDPFAGSGTTLIAADSVGLQSIGFEAHPMIYRVAKAKTNWNVDIKKFTANCNSVLAAASAVRSRTNSRYRTISLLHRCFEETNFIKLNALREAYIALAKSTPEWELVWLSIISIVRACSTAGTAQWQYILPNKKKVKVLDAFDAFLLKQQQISDDISFARESGYVSGSTMIQTDAREPKIHKKFDFLITSPPYPNNYDYADSTRLEMMFWGEIDGWGELQPKVRRYLIRSCSQHSAIEKLELDTLMKNEILLPIYPELSLACNELARVRLTKGGKKTYHTMAAAYFLDLANTFKALRPLMKPGSTMCFVIGDSAPYGVYLSVDKWLGVLAIAAGFKSWSFEKIRDRNTKWKNRKHRVPLHEGRLWIRG